MLSSSPVTADNGDRHHAAAAEAGRGNRRAAACGSARSCATPISPITRWSSSAIRFLPARSWPAPRSSCATWPRQAAISCSGRAAITSTTRRRPATNASPAAAAPPSTATIACTRSSARARPASRSHPSDMCVALAMLEAKVHVTGASGDRVIAFADFHRLPGDTPQRDTNLNAGRDHHRGGAAAAGLRHELHLSEDPRPALVCVRAGVGRGRARARRRHHQGGTLRARRRRAQAVARSTGGSCAARAACRSPRRSLARRTCCCATPRATGTILSRSISRAAPSCARSHKPRAARRSRSRPRRSAEDSHGTLYRHRHIPHRRPREGHRRGQICRRVQRARPRSMAASSPRRSRRAASRASIPAPRCASRA